MREADAKRSYWDRMATRRTFTHPLRAELIRNRVPAAGRILDYGCGYGRTCAQLVEAGYADVVGVDTSAAMIRQGLHLHPHLKLRHIAPDAIPFAGNTFAACLLFAVLTCIPENSNQQRLATELHRVLQPNGILYLSDYPLQSNARNRKRYDRFKDEFGTFGVFRLPDGGVFRHHAMAWIYALMSDFSILREETLEVTTMNGNPAKIFQIIAKKTSADAEA
jgi:SAM-dependent methyltransferase